MSTIDYIMKPVMADELVAAIERAQVQIGAGKIMKS
jgi:two-component SAPR family response regulator